MSAAETVTRWEYAETGEPETCCACGETFAMHPAYRANLLPHCPKCLGVEGADPDTIREGAFD
jgi:hypothetical protein